ncbi:MAG: hypothetical protein WCY78_02505 [Sphaerochaetaceae bacterium]
MIFLKAQDGSGYADEALKKHLFKGLKALGKRERILFITPATPLEEKLTAWATEYYAECYKVILPIRDFCSSKGHFFDKDLLANKEWEEDVVTLGTVDPPMIKELSGGHLSLSWKVQVNKLLVTGGFDLILSFSGVTPNEFTGFSGPLDNIFLRSGGTEGVNKYRYLAALYGQEKIIGQVENPVQELLDYAFTNYAKDLPLVFVHSLLSIEGEAIALFIGDDRESFNEACNLVKRLNITQLEQPVKKIVVSLDESYTTIWRANQAITHTRGALADGGELVIIAPLVERFCFNPKRETLIRKYGYSGREAILDAVTHNDDLKENLAIAAHLINSSSEGRFTVRYCSSRLNRRVLESVGFLWGEVKEYQGEKDVYYISNMINGLWRVKHAAPL